jgi:hypothetical protein
MRTEIWLVGIGYHVIDVVGYWYQSTAIGDMDFIVVHWMAVAVADDFGCGRHRLWI